MKRFSPARMLFALSFILLCFQPMNAQSLLINEFMASNTSAIADPEYHEYADWVELYNAGSSAINVKGYSITDKLALPIVSVKSGFYPGSLSVSIVHPQTNVTLRYTLDGHTPTQASPVYIISALGGLDNCSPCQSIQAGEPAEYGRYPTYFINEKTELLAFSLVTDPEHFFSDSSGIYVIGTNGIIGHCSTDPRNWNQEWERPVTLEFFEKDRKSAFNVPAGVQIYGGCTRLYPEKSLAFYFRGT